jgi:hypothetical protein
VNRLQINVSPITYDSFYHAYSTLYLLWFAASRISEENKRQPDMPVKHLRRLVDPMESVNAKYKEKMSGRLSKSRVAELTAKIAARCTLPRVVHGTGMMSTALLMMLCMLL